MRARELKRIYPKDRGFGIREQNFGDKEILGASGKGVVDVRELDLLPGVERAAA